MNILKENIGQLNDIISLEVQATDYKEKVENTLKDLRRKANIPGFRVGHVPMGMINKMYRKSVLADEITKIVQDNLLNYIKENNINILFEPLPLPEKTQGDFDKEDGNFTFFFEIGLQPEFEIDYEKTKKIKYLKISANEKDIEEEIKKMRHKMGKFSSTEVVADEDMLLVKVLAEDDVKEEFTASLLLSYVKEEHKKLFIGKKLHDSIQFNTQEVFKSEYERSTFLKVKIEDLADAPLTISIQIDAIHHIELAELNDEFFKNAFPNAEVKDEKSLKEHVRKQIELGYERDEKMYFHTKVMEMLMDNINIDLPSDFIKKYLLSDNNKEYTAENIDEKYDGIKKSILYQLIEDKIAKAAKIDVGKDEITRYIKDYIRSAYFGTASNQTLPEEQEEQIASFTNEMLKKSENAKNAYENIFSEKIIAELIKNINPTIEKVTFDKFVEIISNKPEKNKKNPLNNNTK